MNQTHQSSTHVAKIGDDLADALPALISTMEDIDKITLKTIPCPAPIANRLGSGILAVSRQLPDYKNPPVPSFWWMVLRDAVTRPRSDTFLRNLFSAALFHASSLKASSSEDVSSWEFTPALIRDRVAKVPSDHFLALSSKVMTKSQSAMHVPLLDLALPYSKSNTQMLVVAARQLGLHGAILTNRQSYHYYGLHLLSSKEYFNEFLGSALLLAPLVDARWIAHQLIDGEANLRLSCLAHSEQSSILIATI